MIMDAKLLFSDSQALTSTAATTIASTNIVDLGPLDSGNLYRNINYGNPVYMVGRMTVAGASTGSATLTVNLVTDNNEGLTSTALVEALTGAIAVASLTKGARLFATPIDKTKNLEQYLSVNYVVGTAPLSAGQITTAIVSDVDAFYAYAQDYSNLF